LRAAKSCIFRQAKNSVKFAEIDRAMASALEQVPVGDKYAQVSYETLVKCVAN
jgi:hypothetical protein